MSSLIQVSESNAIIYISTCPFFGQLRTIRDIGGTRSTDNTITVSTVGCTFSDNTTAKIIDTPYASITVFTSTATVVHAFPFTYNGTANTNSLSVQGILNIEGSGHIYDSLLVANRLSNTGYIDANSITIGSNDVLTQPLLLSNIQALGQSYTSSLYIPINTLSNSSNTYSTKDTLVSTVQGLGQRYNSSYALQSTIDGLGTYYISTNTMVSTVVGLSNSFTTPSNLKSTVAGLGQIYISSPFLSNYQGGYILAATYASTVAGLGFTGYISSASLTSTVQGLGTYYVSTSWLVSTVIGLEGCNMGDVSHIYISTVEGLGQTYISTGGLVSTTSGVLTANSNILLSTIQGLGTTYISVSQLTSTVNGLGSNYISTTGLYSTVAGLVDANYTNVLVSTVQGLGQTYLSTTNLRSTTAGVLSNESVQLVSTVQGLGQAYISTASLVSTVQGLSNTYVKSSNLLQQVTTFSNTLATSAELTSSINNLGTKLYYSTASLTSTIQGLGNTYISTSGLTANVDTELVNFSNAYKTNLTSTVNGLGNTYVSSYVTYAKSIYSASSPILTSTVSGVTTVLGAFPSATSNSITITGGNSNNFYLYDSGSNSILPSLNLLVTTTGISARSIYSTCNVSATNFYASNYYADGTQLTSISDRRLKEDIVPLSNAIDIISGLTGVYYVLKDEPEKRKLGFIAQDVETVLPDLVFTGAHKSMKYESINVVLLEAIKELNRECDSFLSTLSV